MITISIQEFEEKFEEYVDRAGEGASFLIQNPEGNLILVPHDDYCDAELKNLYCTGTNCADG